MNIFRQSILHIRDLPVPFWILIAGTLLNQMGNMGFVFLIPYLTKHLAFTLPQASFAFAIFGFGMLSSGIIGGTFVDRFGATRIIIGALFFNGLLLIGFIGFKHVIPIYIVCLLWGFIFGLVRPAGQTLVSFLSPAGIHKITFSIFRWALNLGMSIGPAMGGYLANYSFPSLFVINGVINILAAAVFFFGFKGTAWFTYRPLQGHKIELSIKWIKRDAVLRLFLLGMIPVSMVFYQHESTLPVFLTENLHLQLSFYGWLFTLNTLIIVFCELPLNIATLSWSPRTNLILGSILITAGFAGMIWASQGLHVVIAAIIWTIGEMMLFPSATTYVAEIAPEKYRGSYISLFNASSNIGLCLGPFGGAIVMHHFAANGLWLACGMLGILSILIFKFLPKRI